MGRRQNVKSIFPLLCLTTLSTLAQPLAPSADFPIDAARRTRVIEKAADQIERYYYSETLARQMASAVRQKLSSGGYDRLSSAAPLCQELQADLRAVSRDGHIACIWSAAGLPMFNPDLPPPPPTADQLRQAEILAQKTNGFITDATWLPGNVGYISLDAFTNPGDMRKQLGHAMNFVANTDALIVDMRDNKGGSPAAVAALASYFFDEQPVHLNDIVSPRDGKREEFWTERELAGARYGVTRPVFVLTAARTFSAPEELAYDLQALGRAMVVGEQTGGGANPTSGVPIDENFGLAIPRATARNPHTGTNWEAVGVQPDVRVNAASAKDAAYLMALLLLRDQQGVPPFLRDQRQIAIQQLLSSLGDESSQQAADAAQLQRR